MISRQMLSSATSTSPGTRPLHWTLLLASARRSTILRPLPHHIRHPSWTSRAWQSSSTGQKQSGHIETGHNEGVLFFDNLFPQKLSTLILRRPFQSHNASDREIAELLKRFNSPARSLTDPVHLLKRSLPKDLPITVTQILLRLKDGGAFVKFKRSHNVSLSEIETKLQKFHETSPLKPWFSPFRGIRAGLVQGVPWLEDLLRFPETRIKVEFVPADADGNAVELSQEHLYNLFRRYGKIAEITSQASESKISPRYAYMDFAITRDAIMARNCLHGLVVDASQGGGKTGTLLRLNYEDRPTKASWFWAWFKGHPRLVIPVVAALLAAVTVAVFDPIRTFFVEMHIQQTLKLSNMRLYRWFKSQASDLPLPPGLGGKKKPEADKKSLDTVWEHRKEVINKIQKWLLETGEGVVVVQGPRGSGKKELLLDQALVGRESVLVVDVKPIADARGESATIRELAQAVGYRPVFSWANSMSSLLDLAVQSTTGVKSGFSETLESQISKILHTTGSALRKTALNKRDEGGKRVDKGLSDDAWLEAHPEKRPIVVVENFLHAPAAGTTNGGGVKDESIGVLNEKVAEWAATIVYNNIAHVLVLVEDGVAAGKTLGKAMPDRSFKSVTLGDLSPEVAKKLILGHLDEDASDQQQQGSGNNGSFSSSDETEDSGPLNWLLSRGRKPTANNNEKTLLEARERAARARKRAELSRELDECIPVLGGRLNDLELLARRIRSGQSAREAVDEIISAASSDLLKAFLFISKKKRQDEGRKWSPEQAWYLVRKLAEGGTVRYNRVVVDGEFAGTGVPGVTPEEAIDGLVGEELVALGGAKASSSFGDDNFEDDGGKITAGRPVSIRPGRPVYRAAFRALARDRALDAKMEISVLKEQVADAGRTVEGAEKELALLSQVGRSRETAGRAEYLMRKIEGAQKGLEMNEKRMVVLKGVLGASD